MVIGTAPGSTDAATNALAVALAAFPVDRWRPARRKGDAAVHRHHAH